MKRVKFLMAALCCALLLCGTTAGGQEASLPDAGSWTIQAAQHADVSFELRIRSANESHDWGHDVSLDKLQGLAPSELRSIGANVSFDLVRDAGTFKCEGRVAGGSGGGTFHFLPNSNFASELGALGVTAPTADEQRRMAFADVSLGFVRILQANHYAASAPRDLIRLAEHGVSAQFVVELARLGYRPESVDDLVEFVDHGVSIGFIEGLRRFGYRPTGPDLVRMVDHGVSLSFVEATHSIGHPTTLEDFVRMADHGVTTGFIRRMASHGRTLSVDELVRVRDVGI